MTVIFIHPDLPDPAGIDFSHPGHDRSDDFAVLVDQFSVDLNIIVFYLQVLFIKAFIELVTYIFGIFLDMTAAGKTKTVLTAFAAIIVVFSLLTLVVILIQFCIAGAIARKNPFKALWTMLPAYLTALGTSSSAATIPVTRAQTIANGVRPEVADFVVPLCATVHLAGSTVKIVSCAVALMLMNGQTDQITLTTFAGFIAMVGVVMVAAPGVPGGAVMAALGILESILGFDQAQLALMITLYVATDSIGTACNITGDGAIALVMDRLSRSHS